MPAAWYSKIRPDYYHIRWYCDRRRGIRDGNTTGQFIYGAHIGEELTVRVNGLEYTLKLCEDCDWLINIKEREFDPPVRRVRRNG